MKGTQVAWNKLQKPGLKMATPIISAAVGVKTKKLKKAQITSNILNSLTGGKTFKSNQYAWECFEIEGYRKSFQINLIST